MTKELWSNVDAYIESVLVPSDPALERALETSREAGLPPIAVPPNQGKLLHIFARMIGARRILEVGTLGGYSTIWLARALAPGGRLVTLEYEPRHAEVARANLEGAGLSDHVEVIVGPASESLARLEAERVEPFDLAFVDADKPSNPEYFRRALALSHPGSVIIVDNVVRGGAVADGTSQDAAAAGVRQMNELMATESRVIATAVQTVGVKGHDGFAMALVVEPT